MEAMDSFQRTVEDLASLDTALRTRMPPRFRLGIYRNCRLWKSLGNPANLSTLFRLRMFATQFMDRKMIGLREDTGRGMGDIDRRIREDVIVRGRTRIRALVRARGLGLAPVEDIEEDIIVPADTRGNIGRNLGLARGVGVRVGAKAGRGRGIGIEVSLRKRKARDPLPQSHLKTNEPTDGSSICKTSFFRRKFNRKIFFYTLQICKVFVHVHRSLQEKQCFSDAGMVTLAPVTTRTLMEAKLNSVGKHRPKPKEWV